jgi:DNA invertase Pin-like site-specific DNA recombinase
MLIALYARVSTTRQAENDLSIPDQLRQLKDWAKANGHLVVKEYVEPGASATDDKRPVFQQMVSDAMLKPRVFDAIVIHSLSRFFRDAIQFGVYERKLNKAGVKVISITQQTSDDSAGEMMRRIISTFDEYQSKENSKHVIRAMKENARQGFFNGSQPPYGYRSVATDISGSRGRRKKRLEIDETEADIVRKIYHLYLHGLEGQQMGCKEIAKHLTESGLLMRGKPWRMQKVQILLSDTTYMGQYFFGMRDSKGSVTRPVEEWVKTEVPPIIDAATFERVRIVRESRAPAQTPPRLVGSPTLLTGILRCKCGAAMTLATGKGGQYKYYKCTRRQSQGNHACTSANLPMEKTDGRVLRMLAEQVFAAERFQQLVAGLRKQIAESRDDQQTRINEINRQIKQVEERQQRLLDAIESGIVYLDEATQQRAQRIKTAKEALLIELAEARRGASTPAAERINPGQVAMIGQVLREKLAATDSAIAKPFLNQLLDEIVLDGKTLRVKGSYAGLAETMENVKVGTNSVPTFNLNWRARRDSNS